MSSPSSTHLTVISELRAALDEERRAHDATRRELSEVRHQLDTDDQQQVARQLRDALAEKEVLLGEVHHRVKNNLQVITSLLSLQARALDDPAAAEVLKEARQRTFAMALVHDKLYQTHDLNRIDLADYVMSLSQSYAMAWRERGVHITVDAPGTVLVSIDRAVPCGLVVHELVTQACRNGFSDDRGGRVQISLRHVDADEDAQAASEPIELVIDDDGIVPSPPAPDSPRHKSGQRLLQALIRQLRASCDVVHGAHDGLGTCWTLRFAP